MPVATRIGCSEAGAQRRPQVVAVDAPRPSWIFGRRRSWGACLVVLACASSAWAAAPATAASLRVKTSQTVSQLLFAHQVYRAASTREPLHRWLPAHTPLTSERTTLPVVGYANANRRRWLRVMLPGRPNSSTGWIERGGTRETQTGWRIIVSTSQRRVRVYFDGHLLKSYPAVVGKPSTPTPIGDFFVEETEIMPSTAPGGPYVLALSARSNVLQDFDGGPGQIGIHGRDLLGGTLGQAQSHGCMRLATADITWLSERIGPGVPVDIRG
jgi:lipoprotein-anchoring transpeptidase ErfK/SrfK